RDGLGQNGGDIVPVLRERAVNGIQVIPWKQPRLIAENTVGPALRPSRIAFEFHRRRVINRPRPASKDRVGVPMIVTYVTDDRVASRKSASQPYSKQHPLRTRDRKAHRLGTRNVRA